LSAAQAPRAGGAAPRPRTAIRELETIVSRSLRSHLAIAQNPWLFATPEGRGGGGSRASSAGRRPRMSELRTPHLCGPTRSARDVINPVAVRCVEHLSVSRSLHAMSARIAPRNSCAADRSVRPDRNWLSTTSVGLPRTSRAQRTRAKRTRTARRPFPSASSRRRSKGRSETVEQNDRDAVT